MKFKIPKVVRAIRLAEYAAEYGEVEIQVLVNPPRGKLQEHYEQLNRALEGQRALTSKTGSPEAALREIEQAGEGMIRWFAEIWSQGLAPETHWSEEDVRQLVEHSNDEDPGLWPWLCKRTREMIGEYRTNQKKV